MPLALRASDQPRIPDPRAVASGNGRLSRGRLRLATARRHRGSAAGAASPRPLIERRRRSRKRNPRLAGEDGTLARGSPSNLHGIAALRLQAEGRTRALAASCMIIASAAPRRASSRLKGEAARSSPRPPRGLRTAGPCRTFACATIRTTVGTAPAARESPCPRDCRQPAPDQNRRGPAAEPVIPTRPRPGSALSRHGLRPPGRRSRCERSTRCPCPRNHAAKRSPT